jgi:hypothetical protein
MKNADLLIVSKHVIKVSNCGTFCFRSCRYLWEFDAFDPTCRMPERDKVKLKVENGCILRTDFCKRNEVKGCKVLECGSIECPTTQGEMFVRNNCEYCPKFNVENSNILGKA